MKKYENNCSRRNFLKTAGAVGAGLLLTSMGGSSTASAAPTARANTDIAVPKRPFGQTGRLVAEAIKALA